MGFAGVGWNGWVFGAGVGFGALLGPESTGGFSFVGGLVCGFGFCLPAIMCRSFVVGVWCWLGLLFGNCIVDASILQGISEVC